MTSKHTLPLRADFLSFPFLAWLDFTSLDSTPVLPSGVIRWPSTWRQTWRSLSSCKALSKRTWTTTTRTARRTSCIAPPVFTPPRRRCTNSNSRGEAVIIPMFWLRWGASYPTYSYRRKNKQKRQRRLQKNRRRSCTTSWHRVLVVILNCFMVVGQRQECGGCIFAGLCVP